MGLDMYLYAEKYVSNYPHSKGVNKEPYEALVNLVGLPPSEHSPSATAQVTVYYWRKANAIHGWFVENCQDGVDECQRSYVSKDQLRELIEACETDNLETRSGFFFGSTEKDGWYYEELKETAKALKELLANPASEDVAFYYQSSW